MSRTVQPLDTTNAFLGAYLFIGAEKFLPEKLTLGQTIHLASIATLIDTPGTTLPVEGDWLERISRKMEQVVGEEDWTSTERASLLSVGIKYVLERATKGDIISHPGYREFYTQFVEAYKAGLRDSGLITQRIACWTEECGVPFPELEMNDD